MACSGAFVSVVTFLRPPGTSPVSPLLLLRAPLGDLESNRRVDDASAVRITQCDPMRAGNQAKNGGLTGSAGDCPAVHLPHERFRAEGRTSPVEHLAKQGRRLIWRECPTVQGLQNA